MKAKRTKKSKVFYIITPIISFVFAMIIIFCFISGFSDVDSANMQQQINQTHSAILKSACLCYSIEGQYPPDINYLEENYGLFLNHDKYLIDYEIIAENISPEIKVFIKD